MGNEIESLGVEGQDYNKVEKNGREIIVPIRKSDDEKYNSDPQIRALQMVQEGKIGGPGRGQGRKRKPRAAEQVAEAVKLRANKIINALDAGLDSDSVKLKLQAADMALKIEREEALLVLKEDEQDIDNQSKEDLIATLFSLVAEPSTEAILEQVIDLPPEAVREVRTDHFAKHEAAKEQREGEAAAWAAEVTRGAGPGSSQGLATSVEETGPKLRSFGSNGRRSGTRDRPKDSDPKPARSRRRSAD